MDRDLSDTEISTMPGGEFKTTIIRRLAGLGQIMEHFREDFYHRDKRIKKQSEMKNVTEL